VKKLSQAQRTLEAEVASAKDTIRKKEVDIKSLQQALVAEKSNRQYGGAKSVESIFSSHSQT
jgi:hypothetical protein